MEACLRHTVTTCRGGGEPKGQTKAEGGLSYPPPCRWSVFTQSYTASLTLVPRHLYRSAFISAHIPIKARDREDTKERGEWSPGWTKVENVSDGRGWRRLEFQRARKCRGLRATEYSPSNGDRRGMWVRVGVEIDPRKSMDLSNTIRSSAVAVSSKSRSTLGIVA